MDCKIIADLLPLYHDEAVSEESRILVEEHLKTCDDCTKMLEDIRENVKVTDAPGTEQPLASGFKSLKKKLHRKTLSFITLAVVCAAVVVSALFYGVFFYETPVPYSEAAKTINYPVSSALDLVADTRGYNSLGVFKKGDFVYICYSDTFWSRYFAKWIIRSNIRLYGDFPVPEPQPVSPVKPALPDPGSHDIINLPSIVEPPDPPEPPDPLNQISEATKVFYLEGNLGWLSYDEAAFSKAVADAVLLWEK